MDIKYVFIAGEKKWAYLLTIIDAFSRCLPAQLFARSIRANDVIALLKHHTPEWKNTTRIRIRTDNGSQFIANDVALTLEKLHIDHEFTHLALRVAFQRKMPLSNHGTAFFSAK
jgi:putative transposase